MKKTTFILSLLTIFLVACSSNRLTTALTPSANSVNNNEVQKAKSTPANSSTNLPLTEADIIAPAPSGRNLQPQLLEANIPLSDITALLPPDAIPAILPNEVDRLLVSARVANDNGLDPETRVIGLSINGESHAYPIPFMSSHEIVNDEVGGKKIAVTW